MSWPQLFSKHWSSAAVLEFQLDSKYYERKQLQAFYVTLLQTFPHSLKILEKTVLLHQNIRKKNPFCQPPIHALCAFGWLCYALETWISLMVSEISLSQPKLTSIQQLYPLNFVGSICKMKLFIIQLFLSFTYCPFPRVGYSCPFWNQIRIPKLSLFCPINLCGT